MKFVEKIGAVYFPAAVKKLLILAAKAVKLKIVVKFEIVVAKKVTI